MLRTHLIDAHYCGYTKISSVYMLLAKNGESALIDSGTPGSFGSILQAMSSFGANPAKLSSIFLTHCHLDHSGNVSLFTRHFPHIRIYCSELGISRVVHPEKHCRIMSHFIGEHWAMEFHDEVLPVPQKFFGPTHDGMRIPFGSSAVIRVLDAPGHSPDHVSFVDESSGTLFAGDSFGVRYAVIDDHKSFISIPPGFNPTDLYATLKKFKELKDISRAGISHYGFVNDVQDHANQCIHFMDKLMEVARSTGDIEENLKKLYLSEFGKNALKLHRIRGNLLANLTGLQDRLHPSKAFVI
jgi:glyoxylase-like metal-dependent hydrolase (beta-lactamase superfamily II)